MPASQPLEVGTICREASHYSVEWVLRLPSRGPQCRQGRGRPHSFGIRTLPQ